MELQGSSRALAADPRLVVECFVSVHFSHSCFVARGRDLFSPSICK
jgi:hypothetical protein